MSPVLSAIGGIVLSAGAITGFAYWIFRTFASKWLDNRFAKDLEDFKHQHQRELQRLRLEIDSLLDRTIKLHGKEFDTLPQAWALLDDAFSRAAATSLAFMQYANLELMTDTQLNEFLEKEDLPNHKKEELKRVTDKNRVYADALQWVALHKANRARGEFHSFVMKNGIFFPDPIRTQFLNINAMMIRALVEREVAMSHPHMAQKFDEAQKLHEEGRKLVEKLQGKIHDRLWSSQTQPKTEPVTSVVRTS